MKLTRITPWFRPVLIAGTAAGLLASCSTLNYYTQAAQGQLELLSDARPIDDWIADPGTSTKLRHRLETARQIRRFAVAEMALPDNNSYKNYAALKRQYVLWNVVATPELSLRPLQWCFPVAGCVNYRGYYDKAAAESYAKELRDAGDDVEVGGVAAYSTLGWFSDPLISTFINYPDGELARMIFHELAHQIVYVQGDSQFNEAFASTVEEVGVERWMERFGNQQMRDAYARYRSRKKDFLGLLMKYRKALEQNYALVDRSDAQKRAVKARLFQDLKDEYQVLKGNWGGYAGYDRFFEQPLSNAHLASIATYEDFVPAFRALLQREGSFPKFYQAVKKLADMDRSDRHRVLNALVPPLVTAPLMVQRSEIRP
ncbi:aminopeptidase [Massilia sp. Root133]|uniref:aminopeptidase n=1 Tax=Massilia sp. Root133 TaxID=1736455 RepID=UPI0006F3163F|nr:aminopeptidase [Massilia sp. Root133]KQY16886.1 aminopeptidase [Massilia sp. Root133]